MTRRTRTVQFRVTNEEHATLVERAGGVELSEWCRRKLLGAKSAAVDGRKERWSSFRERVRSVLADYQPDELDDLVEQRTLTVFAELLGDGRPLNRPETGIVIEEARAELTRRAS